MFESTELPFLWSLRRWAGKQRDFVRDRTNVAEVRLRARLAEIKSMFSGGSEEPAHGLFLYHRDNAATKRHFERLVTETEGLVIWHRIFNPDGAATPQTDLPYQHPSLTMPRRFDEMLERGGRVQGGYLDLVALPSMLATSAGFVWLIEYDVDFSGHWSTFFSRFKNNRADFLATMLASHAESEDWAHWPGAMAPQSIHRTRRYRAFNPLMRLSRRFALAYVEAIRDRGWRGHYEFTLPTVAVNAGFSVEEIGGDRRLCPPQRRGQIYTAPANQELSGPASFAWRPVIPGYYVDRPELFPAKGLLYHPCKTDVPDWTVPGAQENLDAQAVPTPQLRVAIILATYNGASHLAEQLASLARQTRLPDELVVADDASTDETLAMLYEFAATAPMPVKIIARTSRLGYTANFIATAQETTCDLLLFCDQDDIWDNFKVQMIVNAAQVVPALAYAHDLTVFDIRREANTGVIPFYFDHLLSLGLARDLCIKGCCLAIKADFIRKIGWPPESSISHDAWVSILTTALGQRSLVELPLVRHRIHSLNASGWLITEKEALNLSKSSRLERLSVDDAFVSMLDFYLHAWPPEWIDILRERLVTAGLQIDPVRAQAAIRALEGWRSGHQSTERAVVADAMDQHFYRSQNADLSEVDDVVGHYLDYGWREGRNPTTEFSTNFYLSANPDVVEAGVEPFSHYLLYGRGEGRKPKPESETELLLYAKSISFLQPSQSMSGQIGVVAMVKNEADIIETFMSHVLALFDVVVVIDHGSTDGTLQFLEDVSVGDPRLTLLHFKEPGYMQAEAMNHVLRTQPQLKALDWLFFLDADEFLPFGDRQEMDECLSRYQGRPVVSMQWSNLIPARYDCDRFDLSIFSKFFAPPVGSPYRKIFVQPARLNFEKVWLQQGNHGLDCFEPRLELPAEPADFQLLHFPVRSHAQFQKKLDQGVRALKIAALPDGLGQHWVDLHDYLQRSDVSSELLNAIISTYGEKVEFGVTYTHDELLKREFEEREIRVAQLDASIGILWRRPTDLEREDLLMNGDWRQSLAG